MKVAAPLQIYILQRSCHHNPEPINLNPEPYLCFQTCGMVHKRKNCREF